MAHSHKIARRAEVWVWAVTIMQWHLGRVQGSKGQRWDRFNAQGYRVAPSGSFWSRCPKYPNFQKWARRLHICTTMILKENRDTVIRASVLNENESISKQFTWNRKLSVEAARSTHWNCQWKFSNRKSTGIVASISILIHFLLNLIAGLRVRRRHVSGRGEPGRAAPVQRQGGRRSAHGKKEISDSRNSSHLHILVLWREYAIELLRANRLSLSRPGQASGVFRAFQIVGYCTVITDLK